ncbi:hypothetical protein J2W32_001052 [Variovorax boronicumulans]|uniref:DUF4062 domain-containing protein n=1 Tax=Variovorax boronicumulans TaxID=436515 RepID=A0AAW8CX76_9BURK|nr:DUF4062 domain-containing protein [Variovorax boronicumulans]MDP9892504.1 hypothetical protein [Variovorax boronicumulans]MDQ0052016.1 hypothetical protein [Variovorax boronicumulans]
MKKPTFFLSSTIYDFQDLRSAIKYHLENKGFTVSASEYGDFPKSLDQNSYEACLSALQKADYFILLIGSRTGGWYDKPGNITITRQEYREAYKLHLAGKLRIITFVRNSVWQLKDDRKELAKYLEGIDLEPSVKAAIAHHPTKSVSNADFLIDFINEVSRAAEMQAALKNEQPLPTGNWVHPFNSFRDIADVLNVQTIANLPIEDSLLLKHLHTELIGVLKRTLLGIQGKAVSPERLVMKVHKSLGLENFDISKQKTVVVPKEDIDRLNMLLIYVTGKHLHLQITQKILESSTLMEYDSTASAFQETPAFQALSKFAKEVADFNNLLEKFSIAEFLKSSGLPNQKAGFSTLDIWASLPMLVLLDRWVNVIKLAEVLLIFLKTGIVPSYELRPTSPLPLMNSQLKEEEVTEEQATKYSDGLA